MFCLVSIQGLSAKFSKKYQRTYQMEKTPASIEGEQEINISGRCHSPI
ncbi:hypothetical protein RUMHYD_02569 [Blautia hydrogenotrophica DSM 10507]|uniref:Uncharacterized protein n=1 Tax=Blautia hydrogenotrophica (strain DSM 10507 / JCM 14656 / S5a33) TaxID=476272 RepID=C0CNW8_BLAHS|nr:hypothetical protein RUMHYD_02569 [Blautia hydrogenotrophica DSM 10507]